MHTGFKLAVDLITEAKAGQVVKKSVQAWFEQVSCSYRIFNT